MNDKKLLHIFLSPPYMFGYEEEFVAETFRLSWIVVLDSIADIFRMAFFVCKSN